MNIAFFVNSVIFEPIQRLIRWWITGKVSAHHRAMPKQETQPFAPKSIAASALMARAKGQNFVEQKPLRVVRVVEPGQARASVGRMVISGRMADVCAELDRLAAREAALS